MVGGRLARALSSRLSPRGASRVRFRHAALAAATLAAAHAAPAAPAPRFYPGIAEYQSMRAHDALRAFYNGDMPRAERILRDLGAHEDAEGLPPLSPLLATAMHGLYLQRDDAGGREEARRVRAAFDSAAQDGLKACAARSPARGGGGATCGLIEGGIRGFRAILDLNARGPADVLSEGLSAVSLLERALENDSAVRDAHLGLGIFNAMAASNSPRVVRGMLRAAGRGVSLDEGLAHLRRSGYEGQYTSVASQFFLIRFLSPYDDELRREKTEIFRSLRATFPLSPLVPFLQNHEALVFYPDSFYRPRARAALARTLRAVEVRDYAGARYVQLLKHQYSLLTDRPEPQYRPDTAFDLGGYAFYPDFIEALRLRREILGGEGAGPGSGSARRAAASPGIAVAPGEEQGEGTAEAERTDKIKRVAALRKELLSRLRKTDKSLLNPQNRGLLEWHVGDALRAEQFVRKPAAKNDENENDNKQGAGGAPPKARNGKSASGQPADDSAETTSKSAGKSRKPPER